MAGLAVTVKSTTWTLTEIGWTIAPLEPVMVTTKFPAADPLTVNVAVWLMSDGLRVTLVGVIIAVRPEEDASERLTVAEAP